MMSRSNLMQRLSQVPTGEILALLGDNAIEQLAERYFQYSTNTHEEVVDPSRLVESSGDISPPESAKGKTKRPLNAFMAFRSYYLKIFPDVPQKTTSGFMTTLWNQDPCRNRWALIAKVYSFVRDEMDKGKVTLSGFLANCCPVMKIIEPSAYLTSLGWTVTHEVDGTQHLVRVEAGAHVNLAELQSQNFPNTEIDLLATILSFGYLPMDRYELMDRMRANSNPMMTTTFGSNTPPVDSHNAEKLNFMATVGRDPMEAAREIFGSNYDHGVMLESGHRLYEVDDLNHIGHLPLDPPRDPRYYQHGTTHTHIGLPGEPTLDLHTVHEYDCFDLDNPFDMDAALGYTEMEAERSAGFPESPPFSINDDFHFFF